LTRRTARKLAAHKSFIDLSQPKYAYLFGLLQTDGHLSENTNNRGRLSLEISSKDKEILPFLAELFPCKVSIGSRTRTTPFADQYQTSFLKVNDFGVREELKTLGFPVGSKSQTVALPETSYSAADYFRGVIDGDGSIGVTGRGLPFISLVTASEPLAKGFIKYIEQCTGSRKTTSRNTRDGVFNISLFREPAQRLIQDLYYPGCLAIQRKSSAASQAMSWKRPYGMRVFTDRKTWTFDEDAFIQSHSVSDARASLGRSAKSITTRKWRLAHQQKIAGGNYAEGVI
jgi:hypothetical protein